MKHTPWIVNKDATRPAGSPDQCFYCNAGLHSEHMPECVIRNRTVVVKLTVEYVIQVPETWTPDFINFHRNESSRCAGNNIDELKEIHDSGATCFCSSMETEYVREATEQDEEDFRVYADPAKVRP